MKRAGKIKSNYPALKKNGDLAELVGVVWGDGYIGVFPRTEILRIVSNSNNPGFVKRYTNLVEKIFEKSPHVAKRKTSNCIDITIYQKNISKRLDIPAGAKGNKDARVPKWISEDKEYTIRYLRGLYEAEGTLATHKSTYTHKFIFSNRNESMLRNVERLLKKLGFHPHASKDKVQISRKEEVEKASELLQFRQYM